MSRLVAVVRMFHEVGRPAAGVAHHVQGRQSQAGAVHQHADVAGHADVVDVVLLGLQLDGIALVPHREVAQAAQVGVAEQRVVVDAELGIERDQLAAGGERNGVDLDQGGIEPHECGSEPPEQLGGRSHCGPRQPDTGRQAGEIAVGGAVAQRQRGALDDAGITLRPVLDVAAAVSAGEHQGAPRNRIEQHRRVQQLRRLDRLLHIHALDQSAALRCLRGGDPPPEHPAGLLTGRARAVGQAHPAVPCPVAGPDLRLHHKAPAAQPLRGPLRIGCRLDHPPPRDHDAKPHQQLLGLELVKVHVGPRLGTYAFWHMVYQDETSS